MTTPPDLAAIVPCPSGCPYDHSDSRRCPRHSNPPVDLGRPQVAESPEMPARVHAWRASNGDYGWAAGLRSGFGRTEYIRADLHDEAVRHLRSLMPWSSGCNYAEAMAFLARLDAGSKT